MIIPDHIQQAIQSYYAERATPEEIASLESWFREDIEHIRIFAQHGMLEWQMLCEVEKADAAAIMTILREVEAKAKPDFSLLRASVPEMAPIEPDETPVTLRDLWYVAGYLAVKGLRSKTAIIGSIAAVLVFGAVLYVSILGLGSAPKPFDVASDPNRPAPIVATLTAEHNAAWERRPGEDLYAGQRLTLTQGFAEITTNDGAIAILEAPATIELLDNDNALRLHTGKMVGICETKSSKGFLVLTPRMDITDLGTRFGVDANNREAMVHVFEGGVTASRTDASSGTKPTLIAAGESAATSIDTDKIVLKEPDAERFAALQPPPIHLPGTAQGLAAGQPDPNWLVMTTDGMPLDHPAAMPVAHHNTYGGSRDRSGASLGPWWLQYRPTLEPTEQQPKVVHLIQTGFDLDPDLDLQATRLVIAYAADDVVKAIHVNGNRMTELGTRIGKLHHLAIDQHLRPGRNTVVFEVENAWRDADLNTIGLYVRWHLLSDVTYLSKNGR